MRVLFLTHRLPYAPNRGDRIRAHHLLRTLAAHAQVDLVSLVHDGQEASHVIDIEHLVSSATLVRVPRLRNLLRGAGAVALTNRPLTHALLDSSRLRPALRRIVAYARPDIVLAYCSGMAQYLFAPELLDLPAVVDMVDADSAKWAELARATRGLRHWIYRREARVLGTFEARMSRRACAVLAINAREAETLTALAPDARVIVVQNGVDGDGFTAPGLAEPQPTIVFCGVMDYEPNVQGAIWFVERVWPLVRHSRADARLTIVGSRPTAAIRALASAKAGILVTGEVADVRPHLWQSAVAIAPLRVARGTQNKVLEALAAGLPCVITPEVHEGLPLEAAAGCLTAADADGFARLVVKLLDLPPSERRAIAQRADIHRLGWSGQLAALVPLLRECATAPQTLPSATISEKSCS